MKITYSIAKGIVAIIATFILVFPFTSISQTISFGEPYSWQSRISDREVPVKTMPGFDLAQRQLEDNIRDANKIGPWRFGYEYYERIDVMEESVVIDLPGGDKLYRLGIHCPGALSINLIFDIYWLPAGGQLHLYNEDRTAYLGAYTNINNRMDKLLGTEILTGDKIILEYYEPADASARADLLIGTVVHGYRDIGIRAANLIKRVLNASGHCNHDVGCPTGSGWGNQISSVGLIFTGGGTCSGALINNTAEDGTPYFLTARHCGSSYGSWVVRFNWEEMIAPVCADLDLNTDPGPPYDQTVNGATLRASNSGSDFTLVTLDNLTGPLLIDWDLYFAGWDHSDNAPTNSTGIHHPSGDVKKICRDNDAATKNTINFNGNANAMMWRIADWDIGVTEPGSSGSPLFDQNKRIIGQLCCGAAACDGTDDNDAHDYYGRFGISWDGANSGVRLKDWLDPGNTGVTTLNGMDDNLGPPNAVCQNLTKEAGPGCQASASSSEFDDGSSDPNDLSLGFSASPSGPYSFGVTNVTLTVTATDGEMDDCNATITVEDNTVPSAACKDITVQLNAGGSASIAGSDVDNGSSDACGIMTLSVNPNSFTCANIGTNGVTLTVTDNNGLQSNCTATVKVEDNVPPSAFCQNVSVYLDDAGQGSTTAEEVDNGSSDPCGIASKSLDETDFDCSELGDNPVTLTVVDLYGNSSDCNATVSVLDTISPVAFCKDITIYLDTFLMAAAPPDSVDDGSTDNCWVDSLHLDKMYFDCADLGDNQVILTVLDTSGNSDTCHAVVTIENNPVKNGLCCLDGETDQYFIAQVNEYMNNMINPSGDDEGYGDYTGLQLSIVSPYAPYLYFVFYPGTYGGFALQNWELYIDWDQNGCFEPSEKLIDYCTTIPFSRFLNLAGYPPGQYRMRLVMQSDMDADGCQPGELPTDLCGSIGDGEVEDYVLEIPFFTQMSDPAQFESMETQLQVFPNPFADEFYLSIPPPDDMDAGIEIEVISTTGRTMLRQREFPSGAPLRIDTGRWPAGTYFVRVISGERVMLQTILKQ